MSAEIYETDGVAYVGKEPWHGIGTRVDPNSTAQEIMMAAGLGWSVEKVSLLYRSNFSTLLDIAQGYVGIKRMDTGHLLGVTSDRYVPFQNQEGFDIFQRVLDTGLAKVDVAGSLKGGRVVWALASIQGEELAVDPGDIVKPYVLLSFGHDGKRGIRAGFTPVRVVCWNTLSAAETSEGSRFVRVSHKGNVAENVKMLIDTIDLSVQEFRASVADYKRMLNTPINQQDLREYVRVTLGLVESPDNKRATNTIDKVVSLASTGIGNAPYKDTVYGAYNAITQWLTHSAGRNADNRMNSLWFGKNQGVLQLAHDNAMRLAA